MTHLLTHLGIRMVKELAKSGYQFTEDDLNGVKSYINRETRKLEEATEALHIIRGELGGND